MSTETPDPDAGDLAAVADIAADVGEWPDWVVEDVSEEKVIHAREQCRPGTPAQAACTQLLGRVRKRGDRE